MTTIKIAVVAAIAALLFSAGTAIGGTDSTAWSHQQNGIWCKTSHGGVICIPMNAKGYGMAIHRNYVFVMDLSTERRIFTRIQP